jgi:hypothetical protein
MILGGYHIQVKIALILAAVNMLQVLVLRLLQL